MALPDPVFESARAVFRLAGASLRRPDDDEPFIHAVRDEFPSVVARQIPPPEAPLSLPYLALNSSTGSSRIALSSQGLDFDVRFYGDFASDRQRCLTYLATKLQTIMKGWAALGLEPAFLGIVVTLNFAFDASDDPAAAAAYVVEHHTKYEVAAGAVQEAQLRIGVRFEDTYFLNFSTSSYESKTVERPVFPGQTALQVKPWEGDIVARGIQLIVDLNNRLEAIQRREDPVVDAARVDAMLELLDQALARMARPFVESATLRVDELAREQA